MNIEDSEHYQAQGELQRKQTEGNITPYAPQIYEQVQQQQAVIVEQTNPKKVVENVMLRLRGMRKNADGSEEQVAIPKMNKKGIENIWFILESNINQNIILSHLTETDIGNIMNCLQEDLVDDLGLNWRDYGITKKTDLDTINNSVLVNIFSALKRAEGQNEKNWLGKISLEHISPNTRISQGKKEGFWNKFSLN